MDISALISKYKARGILIDTNLLLLVVIGAYATERILTFKRTLQYTLDDYALMVRILANVEKRVTTPNILTEVDNLARQLPVAEHAAVSEVIAQLVSTSFEVWAPSKEITQTDLYPRIGLSDCVTMAVANNDVLVITDDFELSNRLASVGCDALNINHIRNLV